MWSLTAWQKIPNSFTSYLAPSLEWARTQQYPTHSSHPHFNTVITKPLTPDPITKSWYIYEWPLKQMKVKVKVHKVKVEHYLLFMFSLPKISWVVWGIKYICLHLLPVFYLIQPSSKQIIWFYFQKQNSVLPIVFYVPWILP